MLQAELRYAAHPPVTARLEAEGCHRQWCVTAQSKKARKPDLGWVDRLLVAHRDTRVSRTSYLCETQVPLLVLQKQVDGQLLLPVAQLKF
jgi:hypothetical protein